MPTYADLDAWKACHALFMAVYENSEQWRERDSSLADGLQRSSLKAAGKLAWGSGTGNRKMLRHGAEWSAGYLSQLGHDLAVATAMGLIEKERYRELDALRGRATFYVWKLILPELPAGKDGADPPEEPR